jgi:hypothetical protein
MRTLLSNGSFSSATVSALSKYATIFVVCTGETLLKIWHSVGLLWPRQCHEEGRREYMQDIGGVISSTGRECQIKERLCSENK